MTLNDLQNEVLSLTFETEFDSRDAFVFTVNRALREIHSERDRTETLRIYKRKLEAKERYKKLTHIGGVDMEISLCGKAFSLTTVGIGKLLFTDGGLNEEIEFSGTRTVIKRFITSNEASLTFTGDFDYDVYELASFDFLKSDSVSDIPLYSDFEFFNIKDSVPLFLAFSSYPKDTLGAPIRNVKAEGSVLKIPREYEGEIFINYKRLPREILPADVDTEIDISPECSHLLALKCASYLLLDDNEGLAEYYASLYKNGMGAIKLYNRKDTSQKYEDVLGWA